MQHNFLSRDKVLQIREDRDSNIIYETTVFMNLLDFLLSYYFIDSDGHISALNEHYFYNYMELCVQVYLHVLCTLYTTVYV